jgi:hypothetical protein
VVMGGLRKGLWEDTVVKEKGQAHLLPPAPGAAPGSAPAAVPLPPSPQEQHLQEPRGAPAAPGPVTGAAAPAGVGRWEAGGGRGAASCDMYTYDAVIDGACKVMGRGSANKDTHRFMVINGCKLRGRGWLSGRRRGAAP